MDTKILWLVFLAATMCRVGTAQKQCEASDYLVSSALESTMLNASVENLEEQIQVFKSAAMLCPSSGDSWYYRCLLEKRRANTAMAELALRQAKMLGSPALEAGLDPLRVISTAPIAGPVEQKWALLIGTEPGVRERSGSSYRGGHLDVTALASSLENPEVGRFSNSHVKVLTGSEVTRASIENGLNWVAGRASRKDLILVFVAAPVVARQLSSAMGPQYLLTAGEPMPLIELAEYVRSRFAASRSVLIFDNASGRSQDEDWIEQGGPTMSMLTLMKAGVGRAVISSNEEGRNSLFSNSPEYSLFGASFIAALKASKGEKPIAELFQRVQNEVSQQALVQFNARQMRCW